MADRRFPAPAPLPALPLAFSRRAALFGVVSATGLLGAPAVSVVTPAEAEPIVSLHRHFVALQTESDALSGLSEEASDEAWDRAQDVAQELTQRSLTALPTTLAGALAALAWARWEFGRHYVEKEPEPDWMDQWTLAMMDAAIDVLRAQAGAPDEASAGGGHHG